MAPDIALVTLRPQPGIGTDRDLPRIRQAVDDAGGRARVVCWDDPDVDWGGFDLVVIRSPWDYVLRAPEFLAWAGRVAAVTRLANPVDVVRWNADKGYVGELARGGVPVVPTVYVGPGGGDGLPPFDRDFVVKPTVGGGAHLAARYRTDERPAALTHVARLHAEGRTAMAQPYLPGVDVTGERALVFLGGDFLHAIRKGAVLAPGVAYDEEKVSHPDVAVWHPTDAELAVAGRALAAVPGAPDLLYARVDLVDGLDGEPCVMELELVEPNLFLDVHPASLPLVAERFVKAAQ
ncbi:RimK family alpha-L-glutamate ligase [Streptomyces sp. NPDC059063]|uniref:ATP-grasp domain-containing protein n=1 Tax=unclassified Streptomyces TaxID=2593676 RepID=UPI00367EE7BE